MSFQETINELLPELDDIEDHILRERTLATWISAAKRGGWEKDELEDIPYTLVIEPCPDLFTHTRAVTKCSLAIASVFEEIYGSTLHVDRQILLAGGLLHEVGKLLEFQKNDDGSYSRSNSGALLHHSLSGAVIAGELNIPDSIIHIITSQGESGTPKTLEALILSQAELVNAHAFKNKSK